MKQEFIVENGNDTLRLFFMGWGGDRSFFSENESGFPQDTDLMLCSHYADLDFDGTKLECYSRIEVLAWSLGVWVAGKVFSVRPDLLDKVELGIAFNGSPIPVHEYFGISPTVFEATWKGLTENSWKKFVMRMCGSVRERERYAERVSSRTLEDLREELRFLYQESMDWEEKMAVLPSGMIQENGENLRKKLSGRRGCLWNLGIYGLQDRIMLPDHQKAAWEYLGVRGVALDVAHFDRDILDRLVMGNWEDWIK